VFFILRAGGIEELAKITGVLFVVRCLAPDAIKRPTDAVALACAAGLGFATYENFVQLHYLQEWTFSEASWRFILGALVRVPLHALIATLWGAALGISGFVRGRQGGYFQLLVSLAVAMIAHGSWDYLAQYYTASTLVVAVMVVFYLSLWYPYLKLVSLRPLAN
jgi:RsiW-degrading membrane proteinase PrsW (M82 family)